MFGLKGNGRVSSEVPYELVSSHERCVVFTRRILLDQGVELKNENA
jgi:hypothetical protein